MGIVKLSTSRIDFSELKEWRWILRRIWIGFILTCFYLYTIIFIAMAMLPDSDSTKDLWLFLAMKENHIVLM